MEVVVLDPEVAPAAAALDPAAANAEGSEAWKHLASRVRSQEFGRRQRRLRITSLGIRRGLHPPRLEGDYISRD